MVVTVQQYYIDLCWYHHNSVTWFIHCHGTVMDEMLIPWIPRLNSGGCNFLTSLFLRQHSWCQIGWRMYALPGPWGWLCAQSAATAGESSEMHLCTWKRCLNHLSHSYGEKANYSRKNCGIWEAHSTEILELESSKLWGIWFGWISLPVKLIKHFFQPWNQLNTKSNWIT